MRSWLCVLALACAALSAAERKFELRGKIDPAPRKFASVTLHGQDFPFEATTYSGQGGRFRFKKVDPGQYTVIVFLPGRGEVSRTVAVSASLADEKGRIEIPFPFEPTGAAIEASGTVSVGKLSVPDKAKREYARARKALNKRDVEAAIEHLKKAVEIAPGFVAAWNNLGTIAYQSARYQQAEKHFRTALEYEPGDYSPVVNLGGTLLSLNRFQEALKYNRYAVKMRPGESLANSQLGMNWYYLGDPQKALRYLNKAKQLDPNHFSQPQLLLARIYLERGDRDAATLELEDFLRRHPDSLNAAIARDWLKRIRGSPPP